MTDLGTCDRCDRAAIVVVNNRRACMDHLDATMADATRALPVLPYGQGTGATAGWSGSDTSAERAFRERDEGTVTRRQRQALGELAQSGARGLTWKELALIYGWHHGQASGVLSVLHKDGRIARLVERRARCHVYVLPEYVVGRDTQPHGGREPGGGTRPQPAATEPAERDESLAMALADLDRAERRLAAIRALAEEYALLDPADVLAILDDGR